ncbi:MAG: response regulator [Chromatiales bacterium]|nr:response regulator [Chromatiales bacterium]
MNTLDMTELDKKMKRLRVLLVDDSSERRASVEDSLSEVECEVVGFASSSDNLLALVQRLNPEVVIIDMQSPGRDTLESLESIKSAAPKPIVMFTQDDAGESIIRATRAGVKSAYVVDGISKKRVRPILPIRRSNVSSSSAHSPPSSSAPVRNSRNARSSTRPRAF